MRLKVGVDVNLGEDICVKNIFESFFELLDMIVRKVI